MTVLPDWFRRDRIERDIDDELALHIEAHARDLVSEGVPPEEARRRALATFGGMAPIRELTRDARSGRWLEDLLGDLRYAVAPRRRHLQPCEHECRVRLRASCRCRSRM